MPKRQGPVLTEEDVDRHHAKIDVGPVVQAYDHLRASFASLGYEMRPLTGVIAGVAVWEQNGRYLFAWHAKPRHLLFYLRGHALAADSELHNKAIGHHSAGRVAVNNSGESKIRLELLADAEMLTRWLLPQLPLPVLPRKRRAKQA
nr:hypothetical protein [Phenylobacterium sp.]